MNHDKVEHGEGPATLVAIIVAARRAGDRELERETRRQLDARFGVTLNFTQAGRTRKGVSHAD